MMRRATVYIDNDAAVTDQRIAQKCRYDLRKQTQVSYDVHVKRRQMRFVTDVILVLDGGTLGA